jgi:dolichol-phosphate mannosyltransferase
MNAAHTGFSLVIPVRNEAGNIAPLAAEIAAAFERLPVAWECVWVDDGSTDSTWEHIQAVAAGDGRHRHVRIPVGKGQSAALWCGFTAAGGDVLATMDGDGQQQPADVLQLYEDLRVTDSDAVIGIRTSRQDPGLRLLSARLARQARRTILGDTLTDSASPLRVFRRGCLARVYPFKGMHRLLGAIWLIEGYRVSERLVGHRPRREGRSKYGVGNRLFVGLADLAAVAWMRHRGLHLTAGERPARTRRPE